MVASISDIPDGSLVKHFITSGKPGRCFLCGVYVQKLEFHHTCYSPETGLKLCHNCHHKVHFWSNRLEINEKILLLQTRFSNSQTQEILKLNLGQDAFQKLIAPSRQEYQRKIFK